MSKAMKVSIGLMALLLVAALIWIIWLATGSPDDSTTPEPAPSPTTSLDPDEPTPDPTPSEPGETPEPTTPPETPTPSETAEPDEQSFLGEGKATFENFSVELFAWDENTAPEVIPGKVGFDVEVCVLQAVDEGDQTRISDEPWRMEGSSAETRRPVEGVYDPVFPPEGDYAEGECASGWLTFDEFDAEAVEWAIVIYENGLGDRAVWNFH